MHENSHIVVDTQKHIHIVKYEKLSIKQKNHTRIYIFIENVKYIHFHRKSAIYMYILKICFDKFYISAFY